MSETLLIWLFAGAYSLIAILFVMIWHHVIRCKGVGEDMAVIKQIVSESATKSATTSQGSSASCIATANRSRASARRSGCAVTELLTFAIWFARVRIRLDASR